MSETTKVVAIEETQWFDAAVCEPGQPGVFEVDPVITTDFGTEVQCFAYFNGKGFGPICSAPCHAYNLRFSVGSTPGKITMFRGLQEQA